MANHPNRNRTERVIITNLKDEREYVTLPRPHWTGQRETSTGITTEALYVGPRTGRRFVRTHSIWQQRGWNARGVVGTTYREIDLDTYLAFCEKVGCDPIAEPVEA